MCLAQGPQRSDAGEARTRGPSVSSQALYHWATALPNNMAVLDEPVQHHFKLRNSKWCSVSSCTVIEYLRHLQRLWSDCVYAGLSLCWSHIPHCWKTHVAAQKISNVFIRWLSEGKKSKRGITLEASFINHFFNCKKCYASLVFIGDTKIQTWESTIVVGK